jgi:hypothetical protein
MSFNDACTFKKTNNEYTIFQVPHKFGMGSEIHLLYRLIFYRELETYSLLVSLKIRLVSARSISGGVAATK